MKVIVYIKPDCMWCREVLEILPAIQAKRQFELEIRDVTQKEEWFEEMCRLSGPNQSPTLVIESGGHQYILPDSDMEQVLRFFHKTASCTL